MLEKTPEELEAQIQELQRQLAEAEETVSRYRAIFHDFPQGITIADSEGNIVETNLEAEAILGLGPDEHEKRDVESSEWVIVGEDGEPLPSNQWASVVALRENREVCGQLMGVKNADGDLVWLRVSAKPIQETGGVMVTYLDITEQILGEAELKKLAHDQSAILNHVPAYIYFKDTENNIITISRAVADATGLPVEEIVGRHSSEIYPEMAERYWADDLEVVRTRKPKLGIIEPLPTPEGQRWLHTDKLPCFEEDGTVSGVIVMATDITDRIEAEKLTATSEAKFRSLFEHAADAVYLVAMDGHFIDVNRAVQRQTGYSREELLTMSVGDLDQRAIEENDRSRIWLDLETDQTVTVQTHLKRKDETLFPVDIHLSALDVSGERLLLAFVRDVSAREKMIEEVRLSQERLALAFEGANDGLWDWDLATDEVFYSPRWKSMLGYDDNEIEHRLSEWSRLIAPEDGEKAWSILRAYLAGERSGFECEFRMRHKDGHWVDILSRAFAIRDPESGKPVRVVGTHVDITERKELQARLEHAQRLESIGNLAGGIAHDFNNILTPIMGISELLYLELPQGSPQRDNVEEIITASRRGRDLVQRILAFGRLSEGRKAPISLTEVIGEVTKMARASIPASIEIEESMGTKSLVVMADVTHIHQVLLNLMTNAYQAVDLENGRIIVSLIEEDIAETIAQRKQITPGRYACIRVEDNGCGIPPENLDRIFEPYFTTKEHGGGSGIGLSTVYGIVKNHRGHIEVASELNSGTCFTVYLPLLEPSQHSDSRRRTSEAKTGNEHLLIIDDEKAIVNMEKLLLEGLGYRVTAHSSCTGLLSSLASAPEAYDLVITDMTMPEMMGDKLALEIHSIRPDIPVIVCTGYSNRLEGVDASVLGFTRVLQKPVSRADLASAVRGVLDETSD